MYIFKVMIIIIHNHAVLLFIFIRFATLLHSCLASIKKGSKKASAKEITLASHAIGKILTKLRLFSIYNVCCFCYLHIKFHSIAGCLALTVGCSDNAREIFEESVTPLDESLARNKNISVRSLEMLSCILFFSLFSFYDF